MDCRMNYGREFGYEGKWVLWKGLEEQDPELR